MVRLLNKFAVCNGKEITYFNNYSDSLNYVKQLLRFAPESPIVLVRCLHFDDSLELSNFKELCRLIVKDDSGMKLDTGEVDFLKSSFAKINVIKAERWVDAFAKFQ